jgi:hypothetical protein
VTSSACPRCGAPRAAGLECPHCGVVYARAERRAAAPAEAAPAEGLDPAPPLLSAAARFARDNDLAEARMELRLARFGVPAALIVAWIVDHTDLGAFFVRTFFGMWLHELGHAVAAWLTGFPAVPLPWFTSIGGERSFVFALAIAGGLGYAIWRGWTDDDRTLTAAAAAILSVQLFGTVILRPGTARTWITFAGDAGGLLLGALCMAAFYTPPDHKLHRDWLRWGLLVIGAASFVDALHGWWDARRNIEAIAFGEIEDRADTDPTVLLQAGWSVDQMVFRYLALAFLSLVALAVLQYFHVRRTRAALKELEPEEEPERQSA